MSRSAWETGGANEILKAASVFFAWAIDPQLPSYVVEFIARYRDRFGGVEPICRNPARGGVAGRTVDPLRRQDPAAVGIGARRDEALCELFQRVWENYQVYGAHGIWRQLRRDGHQAARRTVERLMRRATADDHRSAVCHYAGCAVTSDPV